MPSTTSPNMNLIIPTVGLEIGPDWALDVNADLALLDQHNHASGNGVQIGSAGLNIDADLPMNGYDLTLIRSVRMSVQGSPISDPSDLGCIYVSGVDLYYNDENGNQIRMTASGGVAGTPGSIGSLVAPASVTYVSATPAFVFQSNVNTSANLDGGTLTIRENVANAKGISLVSPTSLVADYSITLLPALPASSKILRIDNTGALSASLGVDNTTIQITSNNLNVITVPDGAITTAKIGDSQVTSAKIQDNPVFPGTNFASAGSTGVIYGKSATYALNNNAENTMALGYLASGKGYRVVSGVVNNAGTILSGEGFTAAFDGTNKYTITLSVAGSGPVVGIATTNETNNPSYCNTEGTGGTGGSIFRTWNSAGVATGKTINFIIIVPVA